MIDGGDGVGGGGGGGCGRKKNGGKIGRSGKGKLVRYFPETDAVREGLDATGAAPLAADPRTPSPFLSPWASAG